MDTDNTVCDISPPTPNPYARSESPCGYWPKSPVFSPRSPAYSPRSPVFSPHSPVFPPSSPARTPVCFPPSPPYVPNSPMSSPTSPRYPPTPLPQNYSPRSPVYTSIELPSPVQEAPQAPPILKDFSHDLFLPEWRADVLICTSDGVDLYAHELILKLVSPEIREKLRTASLRPGASERLCVALPRTGSAVRILLEYIYPHTIVQIEGFKALNEGLDVARTYEVGGLRELLRGMMRTEGSSVHVSADPVRAYSIACTYGLEEEAKMAARLAVGKVDFRKQRQPEVGDSDRMDTDGGSGGALQELQQRGVGVEHAFALMQKQFTWECVLTDVLLRTSHPDSTLFLTEKEADILVCDHCRTKAMRPPHAVHRYDSLVGLVDWQRIWAERVHSLLLCTPFEECRDLFHPGCVVEIWDRGCEECMVRLMGGQDLFDDWMSRVWRELNRGWLNIF